MFFFLFCELVRARIARKDSRAKGACHGTRKSRKGVWSRGDNCSERVGVERDINRPGLRSKKLSPFFIITICISIRGYFFGKLMTNVSHIVSQCSSAHV